MMRILFLDFSSALNTIQPLMLRGGYGSRGRVGHLPTGSSIPGSSVLYAKLFLCKLLNPEILSNTSAGVWMLDIKHLV